MSFSGSQNSVVKQLEGGIRASAYWIGNRLLSASDVVNDSSVTGANVKLALNTLSSASSAVFPFVGSGLAEQDLAGMMQQYATLKQIESEDKIKMDKASRFLDGSSKVSARVKSLADDLGTDVKRTVESQLNCCDDADCEDCILCKYEYLKKKDGMTKKKLKLALGLT